MCSVACLFWLNCQYLPSDWLERLLWGSIYVVRRLSPHSPGWTVLMTLSLLCCFIVLLRVCGPTYFPTVMAQYSLFVLKVPLNPKQTNKQTFVALHNMFHTPAAQYSLFMLKVVLNTNQLANQSHYCSYPAGVKILSSNPGCRSWADHQQCSRMVWCLSEFPLIRKFNQNLWTIFELSW